MEADIKDILGDDVIVISTSAGSNDDAGFAALFNIHIATAALTSIIMVMSMTMSMVTSTITSMEA
jgi:hypothetical protein